MTKNGFPTWSDQWRREADGIVVRVTDTSSTQRTAFERADGSQQAKRSLNPLQAGFYDMPYYRSAIEEMLHRLPAEGLIADLGSGDGRMTHILLSQSQYRIVAQDFNGGDLRRLVANLDARSAQRVLPVMASVTETPIFSNAADGVILSEVAYTLSNPSEAYRHCAQWLKPNGLALVSNIAVSAYYIHALLNGDLHNVHLAARERQYEDTIAGRPDSALRVHLYDEERMREDAEAAGFFVENRITVPAGVSLAIHAMRRNGILEIPQDTLDTIALSGPTIPRLYIDLLRKV